MTPTDGLRNWIILDSVKYLKSKHLLQLLTRYTAEQLCKMPIDELQAIGFSAAQAKQVINPDEARITALTAWQTQPHQHILYYTHADYPDNLTQIASPPLLLFAYGDLSLLQKTQIAIVGSRNASHYGLDNAFQFAAALAQQNIVITSGFATGVDGHAHKGALSVGGGTIAVLGTGVDIIYPKRHTELAHELYQKGLIISEFPPGTPARAQHFPRRNRIISGLSRGVLVVEAALQSGSLITARYALEHNKEVFAIPNHIHDPRSRGCHKLLREGAKLTETVADILEELVQYEDIQQQFDLLTSENSHNAEKSSNKNFTSDDLLVNLDYKTTSVDVLASRSQLPVDVVLARLLDLELQGLVAAVSGGYVRTRRD
ncbi:DNA-processing protein DprA [Algibacillus agarilyticus]|uniref:DNA-processing protein DprA n=1 Tax=Algibacillus agarilyticus TaxID=2234133 RepID=UPI000DD08C2F|nr:DNA-processing protein DprA [Algibacillus agarilyticus]